MATPSPGDPQVAAERLLGDLEALTNDTAEKLDYSLLGRLIGQLSRAKGIVDKYYSIKLAQKAGG